MNWHTSSIEDEEKKKKPVWLLFIIQFKDVMILILMVAAIISAVVGDVKDMIVILIIIVINAIVGFVQEYRAEKAIDALKKMSAAHVRVRRNKRVEQIPATEIVPGDVVRLGKNPPPRFNNASPISVVAIRTISSGWAYSVTGRL